MMQVKPSQAKRMLIKYLKARRVPMLHGSPGIGKSELVQQVAKEFGLLLIDVRLSQCDPTDLLGFPAIVDGRSTYIPFDTFPLEGKPIPNGYNGWLIFFDEATSTPKAVQAASYKIILDRMVGQDKLHKNVAMVAAGNLETDGAVVEAMSTAMQSRLVHMHLVVDHEEWIEWAHSQMPPVDHRITSYIGFKPGSLHDFRPDHNDVTFACPRTWAFADGVLKVTDENDEDRLPLLAGCITKGYASELLEFFRIHANLPKIKDIEANPETLTMPERLDILWALTDTIAHHATDKNIDPLVKFVKRMPPEFQAVAMKAIIKRNQKLLTHKTIQAWVIEKAPKFFGNAGASI